MQIWAKMLIIEIKSIIMCLWCELRVLIGGDNRM